MHILKCLVVECRSLSITFNYVNFLDFNFQHQNIITYISQNLVKLLIIMEHFLEMKNLMCVYRIILKLIKILQNK